MITQSMNNKLLLEPYQGENKIKANINSGFATVKQKDTLIGLVLLVDANLQRGNSVYLIPKGSKIYFQEEILHAHSWSKKTYESEALGQRFIIADANFAVFIESVE